MFRRITPWRLARWMLGMLMLLGWSAGCYVPTPWQKPLPNPAFQPAPLPIERFHLFDVGVTDLNGDGALDIFSVNHSARQSFLLGDGQGGWQAWPLESTGLSQSTTFPGLEDSDRAPAWREPGLYIYWNASRLILHSHRIQGTPVQGEVLFFTPIATEARGDFGTWTLEESQQGAHSVKRIRFSAAGDGDLILTPQPYPRVGSPVQIRLAEESMIERTFVGIQGQRPSQADFLLDLKDRHGLAWHPLTGARASVLIAGGANLGLTDILEPARRAYELFRWEGERYHRDDAASLGLHKGDCAARKISLQDVNGDGRVDAYVVCIRNTPNQLFTMAPDGTFTETAQAAGLGMPDGGTFAWLDVGEDGQPDLLWAGEDGVWLYRQEGWRFRGEKLSTPKIWAQTITLADFDGDGDGDAFIASKDANLLLIQEEDGLHYRPPETFGLPQASLTAHWLDVDNDGRMDLATIPDGVFRQTPDGQFQPMEVLGWPAMPPLDALRSARAVWFDADNDGYQEAILATQTLDKQWETAYLKRRPGANHWLEVRLHGPAGNEAAMGAKIAVRTSAGSQIGRVGWSESSHYSQGHYRVHFGLGDQTIVDQIAITWPDGKQQTLDRIPADQLLDIAYPNP
ncbi:MAG TPA: CRTAC1 family protein [Caldilineae bacterium]|nr:CRTAC1 family protein [Caldilineae bacterium]